MKTDTYASQREAVDAAIVATEKLYGHQIRRAKELGAEILSNLARVAGSQPGDPVPMVLHCPECGARHVDAGEFAARSHHTHACQSCGFVWRPAVVATVGVQFLPGFRDAVSFPSVPGAKP
jgi:rubredoxin